jgi:hypothetical protein
MMFIICFPSHSSPPSTCSPCCCACGLRRAKNVASRVLPCSHVIFHVTPNNVTPRPPPVVPPTSLRVVNSGSAAARGSLPAVRARTHRAAAAVRCKVRAPTNTRRRAAARLPRARGFARRTARRCNCSRSGAARTARLAAASLRSPSPSPSCRACSLCAPRWVAAASHHSACRGRRSLVHALSRAALCASLGVRCGA